MSLDRLCSQLRASEVELELLASLTEEQQEKLSVQLLNAKTVQHKHVSDAFQDAVGQLPRLMRKPLLKMFEGAL